ncbi:hypothetical protein LCGC14_2626910, partial [marine sediment metagenome]
MSNQRVFSRWTTDEVLNCEIVKQWLLNPTDSRYIKRMEDIDYNAEDMNYNCSKWKSAWESMEFTKEGPIQVGDTTVEGHLWHGIPAQMANDIPAVYKKILGRRAKNEETTFSYQLDGLSILEWIDISASVPIRSLELDIGESKITKEHVGVNVDQIVPFNGGFPMFAAKFSERTLSVHLSEPGVVQVKGYYTSIPTADEDRLRQEQ